jgi:HD-GYP domain-containing protein (c-di-GMP phosphodiesterase class II)
MWKKPGTPIPIDPSQVVIGLYIWLDISWVDHPFLTSRILVSTEKEIAMIRAHHVEGRLYYYPEMSKAEPAPQCAADSQTQAEVSVAALQDAAIRSEVRALELAKKEKLRLQKDVMNRADRNWEEAARATREALLNMARSPKTAGVQLSQLSRQTASAIAKGQDVLLHLLGDKKGQGPQFHALNVMTLCMVLGKHVGLTERELSDLALGALAHDSGKTQVPAAILQSSTRKKFEEDFYRQHVQFSLQFAAESGAFTPEALAVIADHHECADGSGWPKGKKETSRAARVLALVNRYDRLCTPEAPGREALMPSEALATLFRSLAEKFDKALLSSMIKLLGVYPPGTVVHLSDGSLALVVSPGLTSLQPRVLIYSPEVARDDGPTMDLADEPGLKVAEAIRPATLPPDVLEWLNPQQRLSYFYSVSGAST